jgi:hypothetical protein
MEWRHKGYKSPNQFKTQLSAGKIKASVFWEYEGKINIDFVPQVVTIDAQN